MTKPVFRIQGLERWD